MHTVRSAPRSAESDRPKRTDLLYSLTLRVFHTLAAATIPIPADGTSHVHLHLHRGILRMTGIAIVRQDQFVTRCNQGAFDLPVLPTSQRRDGEVAKSESPRRSACGKPNLRPAPVSSISHYVQRDPSLNIIAGPRSRRSRGRTMLMISHASAAVSRQGMNGFDLEWRCPLGSFGTHALEKTPSAAPVVTPRLLFSLEVSRITYVQI